MVHSVFFRFDLQEGSSEFSNFFNQANGLAAIPGVIDLKCVKQTSSKNNFNFGITMQFASKADYDLYNSHPKHLVFVQEQWIPHVSEFMEIDYEDFE